MNQRLVKPVMVFGLAAFSLLGCFPEGCAPDRGTVDVPGAVRAFDPIVALPKVQAFAGPGAQLVSFKANHARSNGTIDLEAPYHREDPVKYTFVRPSGSVEDLNVPVGARRKHSPLWRVDVTVSKTQDIYYICPPAKAKGRCTWTNRGMAAESWENTSISSADAVPLPTCGIDRLWQEASRLGAPADAVATVSYDKTGFAFEIPGTPTKLHFDARCQAKNPESIVPPVERHGTSFVFLGKPAVRGHLDSDLVAKQVRAHIGALKACYERALKGSPAPAGQIKLGFTITATGKVSNPQIREDSLANPDLASCLTTLVGEIAFPKPKSPTEVVLPLELRPME